MENLAPRMEKRYAAMELRGEPGRRVWPYRRAAWSIEDAPQDLGLIYRQMDRKGLESIENVGPKMAGIIEDLIQGSAQSGLEGE